MTNFKCWKVQWQIHSEWIEVWALWCLQIASFTTNSMVRLAHCSILVSSQQMGWSSVHVCSWTFWCMCPYAPSDMFPVNASSCLCTPFCTCTYFVDDVCLLLHKEGMFDLSKEWTEGGSGLEHSTNVEVPLVLSLTPATSFPGRLPLAPWLQPQNGRRSEDNRSPWKPSWGDSPLPPGSVPGAQCIWCVVNTPYCIPLLMC